MSDAVFEAFSGKHFDPVFSITAVVSHAETALKIDEPTLHADAGESIRRVSEFASSLEADPSHRIALIQGRAGLGKTHRLITTLLRLSRERQVYPVVMQLSAKVESDRVSRWMLQKSLDELKASHFRDNRGRSPLQRLADVLWSKDRNNNAYDRYSEALSREDLDAAESIVREAVPRIRKALSSEGLTRSDDPLICALVLIAEDASHDANVWLRGGSPEGRVCGYALPPLFNESDSQDVLMAIARIASATGAPLVIAIDQIEAMTRIGDDKLLAAVVTTALQIVENTPKGVGIVISALNDTYEDAIKSGIDDSFRQRIELGETPVLLDQPSDETIRLVVNKRARLLFERTGIEITERHIERVAPSWLLRRTEVRTIRAVLDLIRQYRESCRAKGRFLTKEEFGKVGLPPQTEDFDKLWEDACDADLGSVANFSAYDKEQLLLWAAEKIAGELPNVEQVRAEAGCFPDAEATRFIDLKFLVEGEKVVERWKIAFVDAPNSKGRLLNQIRSALEHTTDALPAVLRQKKLPGVTENGELDRPIPEVRKLQAGAALIELLSAGGRIALVNTKDWQRLNLARRFVEERSEAAGFGEWCMQKRFLVQHASIGAVATLFEPVGSKPIEEPTTAVGQSDTDRTTGGTSGQTGPFVACSEYMIHVGHGSNGENVYWDLRKDSDPALPNFGISVSGDAGQGKTQIIKAIISETLGIDCPLLIFDFKNDYAGEFANECGFTVLDLNEGLPFNPLRLPPHGPSGAQAINHVYEVGGMLGDTLKLGDQQKALLRDAIEAAYEGAGVPLREWVDPESTPGPSFASVIELSNTLDEKGSERLINRLGLLHGKRLLPADSGSRITFPELLSGRYVLSFSSLPNDNQLKRALAELILIQLQGYMLRGEQPRTLRRLLVFDEAWRASDSVRLIQLAREGRAFGVGIVAGSQFADDLSTELTGNLATKLYLYNSNAEKRRRIVKAVLGKAAGHESVSLSEVLSGLKKFQGILVNQQNTPYTKVEVVPYFNRKRGDGND